MMTIKQGRNPILRVDDRDSVRYVSHANGVIPCACRDAVSDRARAEWRRDPVTGRLQLHWQPSHAPRSSCAARQGSTAASLKNSNSAHPRHPPAVTRNLRGASSTHRLTRVCALHVQGNAVSRTTS